MCSAPSGVLCEMSTETCNDDLDGSKDNAKARNTAKTQIKPNNEQVSDAIPTAFAQEKEVTKKPRENVAFDYFNVIYTFSGINSLIEPFVQNRKLQREKLVIFKSEKQFSSKVEEFFQSDNNILLLQCSSLTDSPFITCERNDREIHSNEQAVSIAEDLCYPGRNKDFIHDFCNNFSVKILNDTDELIRINIFKWALSNFIDLEKIECNDFLTLVAYLHASVWVYGYIINAICHIVKLLMYSVDLSNLNVAELIWFQNTIIGKTVQTMNDEKHFSMNDDTEIQTFETATNASMSDLQADDEAEIKCLIEEMITSVTLNDYVPIPHSDDSDGKTYSLPGEYDGSTACTADSILCLSLLPTKKVFETLIINEWISLVRSILPLAHVIHDECHELTALKFCHELTEDFMKADVFIPVACINDLSQCILECKGNLEAVTVCECLHRILRKLHNDESVKQAVLQKLFCSYILRCMISSPENTEPLTFILNKIKENDMFDPTMSYIGQVVKFAVMIDLSDDRDAYYNMLINEKLFNTDESFDMCFDSIYVIWTSQKIENISLPILLLNAVEHYAFEQCLTIDI
ncbi:unnamed protein product [Mytilus edulis]|uniref:Uncharacterized protein n=1 Tax=Mytilus edulis TaxID=6550 RepID=A0A8S3S399_MYTED|nr:unnamed protein product [Mytilus edulis]